MATLEDFRDVFGKTIKLGEINMVNKEGTGRIDGLKPKTDKNGNPYYTLRLNGDFYNIWQNRAPDVYSYITEELGVEDEVDYEFSVRGNFKYLEKIIKVERPTSEPAQEPPPQPKKEASPKQKSGQSVPKQSDKVSGRDRQNSIMAQVAGKMAINQVDLYNREKMTIEQIDKEVDRLWLDKFKRLKKLIS